MITISISPNVLKHFLCFEIRYLCFYFKRLLACSLLTSFITVWNVCFFYIWPINKDNQQHYLIQNSSTYVGKNVCFRIIVWGHSNNTWHSRGGGNQSVTCYFVILSWPFLRAGIRGPHEVLLKVFCGPRQFFYFNRCLP